MRTTGTTARGIRMPILREGDDLIGIVCESLITASENEGFELYDRDIIGVTEAIVARTQGNYATVNQISEAVREKFGEESIGVVMPILSRNRFAILLKAIAESTKRVILQLTYPSDEVGNSIISQDALFEKGVNPYTDSFDHDGFRKVFGYDTIHKFTGIDYIKYYKSIADNIEIVFSNSPAYILNFTSNVLNCDIHTRFRTQIILKKSGAEKSFRLDEILTSPVGGSGYSEFGLLGSNKATEEKVKLFPRGTKEFVDSLAKRLFERTGKNIEVLIYGDGGFKDPVGGIWELADPVISPAFTSLLNGTPNEIKIKYLADEKYPDLSGEELDEALRNDIRSKNDDQSGKMISEGTTPRQLSDLVGSLCDLISGSGDKGTPIVHISGYFDNFATV